LNLLFFVPLRSFAMSFAVFAFSVFFFQRKGHKDLREARKEKILSILKSLNRVQTVGGSKGWEVISAFWTFFFLQYFFQRKERKVPIAIGTRRSQR
jgi:hypothetical protein